MTEQKIYDNRRKELLKELVAMEQENPVKSIKYPSDIVPMLIKRWGSKRQEYFIVVTLNNHNDIIKTRAVTKGTICKTLVDPREVFRGAILDDAARIIIAHNHPSGALIPSDPDYQITKALVKAGKILGIDVLDHVIFSKKGYRSFVEEGELYKLTMV